MKSGIVTTKFLCECTQTRTWCFFSFSSFQSHSDLLQSYRCSYKWLRHMTWSKRQLVFY